MQQAAVPALVSVALVVVVLLTIAIGVLGVRRGERAAGDAERASGDDDGASGDDERASSDGERAPGEDGRESDGAGRRRKDGDSVGGRVTEDGRDATRRRADPGAGDLHGQNTAAERPGLAVVPPAIVVPDVPPPADPAPGVSRPRRWARAIGRRRLERWRAGRRAAAEKAGDVWDPHERPPWSVAMWGVGDGSREIAVERFRALRDLYPTVEALHERRTPGRRGALVDHLFVGPAGVVVASSHRWEGFVQIRGRRLMVAGRDRMTDVEAVTRRVDAVGRVLADAGFAGVPVHGVLHCVETEDVLVNGALETRDVVVLDALGTLGRAVDGEVLTYEGVRRLVVVLERGLPPAG